MALYRPAFRMTVYAPRSVDATEATILTPIGGASHADPFKVWSLPDNGTGWRPYLEHPRGKQGAIDPITKKWTMGNLTVRVMDKRVTAGGSNSTRWISAFLGDAMGKHRLIGCKIKLERSLDGGASWADYFTGRIVDATLADDAIFIDFSVRDMSAELDRSVFVGRPHASITYAFMPAIIPIGLPFSWGPNFKAKKRLTATLRRISSTVAYLEIAKSNDVRDTLSTAGTEALQNQEVWLTSGPSTGRFRVNWQGNQSLRTNDTFKIYGRVKTSFVKIANIEEVAPTEPGYLAMPADGSTVTFYLTADAPPTKDFPLLISEVNVITLWAALSDGLFSKLRADGSARPIVPRDAAAFAALTTDAPTVTMPIDASVKYREFVEKHICQVYGYGYRLNGAGQLVPIDMRRASTLASGGSITDANLATGPAPKWQLSRELVRSAVQLTYYRDRPVVADTDNTTPSGQLNFPSHGVESIAYDVLVVNDDSDTWLDAGERVMKIDAKGLRMQAGEVVSASGESAIAPKERKAIELGHQAIAPFTSPPGRLPLRCRRGSAAVDNCQPGDLRSVDVTTQPNPGSNVRGGARLMRCLSRSEDEIVSLDFLDMGPGTVSTAPTITSAAIAAADPNRIDVAVTLNASSERAVVRYAVTPAGTGARPADTSPLWTFGAELTASGTARVRNVPAGMRVWIAARTEVKGSDAKLPSAWIYLGAPGYVDVPALAAASGIAVSAIVGNRAKVTWTVGAATARQEVYLNAGGIPGGGWTEAMKVDSLEPSTGVYLLKNLTPSTTYGVGILQRDSMGGKSSMLTTTFATTSTPGTAPAMLGIALAVRSS